MNADLRTTIAMILPDPGAPFRVPGDRDQW
jgi:hypothetical protein